MLYVLWNWREWKVLLNPINYRQLQGSYTVGKDPAKSAACCLSDDILLSSPIMMGACYLYLKVTTNIRYNIYLYFDAKFAFRIQHWLEIEELLHRSDAFQSFQFCWSSDFHDTSRICSLLSYDNLLKKWRRLRGFYTSNRKNVLVWKNREKYGKIAH